MSKLLCLGGREEQGSWRHGIGRWSGAHRLGCSITRPTPTLCSISRSHDLHNRSETKFKRSPNILLTPDILAHSVGDNAIPSYSLSYMPVDSSRERGSEEIILSSGTPPSRRQNHPYPPVAYTHCLPTTTMPFAHLQWCQHGKERVGKTHLASNVVIKYAPRANLTPTAPRIESPTLRLVQVDLSCERVVSRGQLPLRRQRRRSIKT